MIRKITASLVLPLMLTGFGLAQQPSQEQPFSFKGAYLGMPMSEFRELTKQPVSLPTQRPLVTKKEKKHPPTDAAEGPLCSDQYELDYLLKSLNFTQAATLAPIEPPIKGEVVCFTSGAPYAYSATARLPVLADPLKKKKKHKKNIPQDPWNLAGRTVNGMEAINLSYRFYEGKLYRIHMWFTSAQMKTVKEGFFLKYGKPQSVDLEDYENAFARSWKAESYLWTDKEKAIRLRMGSGFGPGQDLYRFDGTAGADFVDAKVRQTVDSRTRASYPTGSAGNAGVHLDF